MEGWKTEKFKKLIDYKSGYTWSKEQELTIEEPNSIRVLTVSNVQDKLDLASELYLTGVSEQDKVKKQVSKDWSIAVSSNGNRNRIGNAIFIDSDTNYLFASFLTAFKPFDNSDISPYYFYLWLSSASVQKKITSVAEGTTGLGNLSIRFLRNMDITYPASLAEQSAIAKILSTVDEAIRSTRETISKLERVKKSLMQNLLSGKMKPDGTLRPATEFYEDEKMGLVPKGWKVVKLGSLFKIKAGGDLQEMFFSNCKDETHIYPVFSNSLDNKGLYGYTSNPRFFADESVTLTGRGNVGHSVYRQGDYDAIIRLISLIPLNPDAIDCRYITYFIDQFTHFSIESTGVPQLTCPRVFKTKIILPQNKNEQLEISQKISNIEIQIENKQAKITALESLKKSLMQQLLTGRVRVK